MMKSLNFRRKKKDGFTLLEMIICIGIFVLVATAASVLFNQALRAYRYTTSRMAAAREAELAMEWIVREIRPDPDSGDALTLADDGDAPPSDNDEITLVDPATGDAVRYFRQGDGTIQREERNNIGVILRTDLLAQHVVSLNFEYFDAENQDLIAAAGELDDAKTVEIIIETSVNEKTFRLYNVANRP